MYLISNKYDVNTNYHDWKFEIIYTLYMITS